MPQEAENFTVPIVTMMSVDFTFLVASYHPHLAQSTQNYVCCQLLDTSNTVSTKLVAWFL